MQSRSKQCSLHTRACVGITIYAKQAPCTSRQCDRNELPPIATGPAQRGAYTPRGGHMHGFMLKKARGPSPAGTTGTANGGGIGRARWSTRHGPTSRVAWVHAVWADQTVRSTLPSTPMARRRAMDWSNVLFARREPMEAGTPTSFIGL